MEVLHITGGQPLGGHVGAAGAKNAALPILAASILADGPVHLHRVPDVADVNTLCTLLRRLGMEVQAEAGGCRTLRTIDPRRCNTGQSLVRRMRAGICVLGPLVARRGRAVVALPGGCRIGPRPIDLHLMGLEALGADIALRDGFLAAKAVRLRGGTIDLCGPHGSSVTATANLLCAAVLARGQTVLRHVAQEPEIVDLGIFLQTLGARIEGLGTSTLEIRGVENLAGGRHELIADRIEVGTLLLAAAVTGGEVTVHDCRPDHLGEVLAALHEAGCGVSATARSITLYCPRRPQPLRVAAEPFPGIPTDLQPPLCVLACLAQGRSVLEDRVFPQRFAHVAALRRFGAHIVAQGNRAVVRGQPALRGAQVRAADLRGGAALVLAALAACGESSVAGLRHLDRGYEHLEQKLAALGAAVARVSPGLTAHDTTDTPAHCALR